MIDFIRDIENKPQVRATAIDELSWGRYTYAKGETFDYQGDLARLTGLARLHLYPALTGKQLALNWIGAVNRADGYGFLSLQALTGLLERGVDVSARPLIEYGLEDTDPQVKALINKPYLLNELLVLMAPAEHAPVVWRGLNSYDEHVNSLARRQFRVLYTMFETDGLPRGWAERINNGVDAVLVPSRFLIDAFKRAGITVPIFLSPAGIDSTLFVPGDRQRARWLGTGDKSIRVCTTGNLTRRKNLAAAIKAFQAVAQDNWTFRIKTQITPEFEEYVLKPVKEANDPRISIITERYSTEEMVAFYQDNDIFLWPSMGEGIGLPPLEAMACGLEVVCSDSSGMSDYLAPKHAYPVKTTPVSAEVLGEIRGWDTSKSNWWDPDPADLAEKLKQAATPLKSKLKGPEAVRYVNKHRSRLVTADSIVSNITTNILPLMEAHRAKSEHNPHYR